MTHVSYIGDPDDKTGPTSIEYGGMAFLLNVRVDVPHASWLEVLRQNRFFVVHDEPSGAPESNSAVTGPPSIDAGGSKAELAPKSAGYELLPLSADEIQFIRELRAPLATGQPETPALTDPPDSPQADAPALGPTPLDSPNAGAPNPIQALKDDAGVAEAVDAAPAESGDQSQETSPVRKAKRITR